MKLACPRCGRPPLDCDCLDKLTSNDEGIEYPLNFMGNGPRLFVRPAWDDLEPRLAVWIELGPDTTHDDVRRALPLARAWRQVLARRQAGPPSQMAALDAANRQGRGPSDLARSLNRYIVECLVESLTTRPKGQYRTDARGNPLDVRSAGKLLRDFGFTEAAATDCIEGALANLRRGKHAFDWPDDPIAPDTLKKRLANWRRPANRGVTRGFSSGRRRK
jgi:hypothetical protein